MSNMSRMRKVVVVDLDRKRGGSQTCDDKAGAISHNAFLGSFSDHLYGMPTIQPKGNREDTGTSLARAREAEYPDVNWLRAAYDLVQIVDKQAQQIASPQPGRMPQV